MNNKEGRSKILSFKRDGEFYFARFEKQIDQGKYSDALVSIRAALKEEPDNLTYILSLGELYCELSMHVEAIALLQKTMKEFGDPFGEILFGVGCNYFGMSQLGHARACLERYLECFPGGSYCEEAQELLYMIAEDEEAQRPSERFLPEPKCPDDKLYVVLGLIEQSRLDEASRMLKQYCEEYPHDASVKSRLAGVLMCMNQYDRAFELLNGVLTRNKNDIAALCKMAPLLELMKKPEDVSSILDRIESLAPDADEECCFKSALTLLCCRRVEQGYFLLKTLLSEHPFDKQYLFSAGAAAYNLGRYQESAVYFSEITKLYPKDSIASFYQECARRGEISDTPLNQIPFAEYQVPQLEALRRLAKLEAFSRGLPEEELLRQFREDAELALIMRWAPCLHLKDVTKAVILTLSKLKGEAEAVSVLEEMLLNEELDSELKQHVGAALIELSVPQPYVALIDGSIVEMSFSKKVKKPSASAKAIIDRASELAICIYKDEEGAELCEKLEALFDVFLSAHQRAPVMRKRDVWAAAFLLEAIRMHAARQDRDAAEALCEDTLNKICDMADVPRDAVLDKQFIIAKAIYGAVGEEPTEG